MPFELPALPYAKNALEPYISQQTFEYHYGKHHQAYVNNLNGLIPGTEYENADLEPIVKKSEGGIFNNAAQVWNHTFYFFQFSPTPATEPTGALKVAIEASFGTVEAFKEAFLKSGSDSVWLRLGMVGKRCCRKVKYCASRKCRKSNA